MSRRAPWEPSLAGCTTLHWSLSQHDNPAYLPHTLGRLDAAYFTVTTFTTTGFGDIEPTSDATHVAVTMQIFSGFLLVAVALVLVLNRVVLTWQVDSVVGTFRLFADSLRTGDTETGY